MKGLLQQFLLIVAVVFLSACIKTDSILERAQKQEDATNYAQACNIYSEGLKTDPNNQVYLWRRAYACLQIGNIDETLTYCDAQLKKNPSDPNPLLLKAFCYDVLRFQELPKRLYEKALASSSSYKTLEEKLLLSYAYGCLKKQKDEEKILKSIIEVCKSPKSAKEFNFKGTALSGLGQFAEARETLKNGLIVYSKAMALHLKLGSLYGSQSNHNKCLEFTNNAIKLQ